jgi:IS1 family transposase
VWLLLGDLGAACAEYQDGAIQNLRTTRVEADEIWSFTYAKQKNVPEEHRGTPGYGDVWTWTAIDADTKLIPSWLVGERSMEDCYTFLADLRSHIRPGHRIQLTTDGLGHYERVVSALWGSTIDYTMLHKQYGNPSESEQRRYSPAECTGIEKRVMSGDPDLDLASTSFVERQNLTMRMGMRRFTRLTNGFSKKIENHAHAVSLHFMHYNFCRKHQTLGTTPAVAAGIERHLSSLTQLAELLD